MLDGPSDPSIPAYAQVNVHPLNIMGTRYMTPKG
ncbi:hypothetical protein J2S00_002933 [Caldalkalibacillus uzonensis]|uniref:Uncharacterized protein n=1 Tax=Caldalkalibacillus uzonensis TaxID=353224 RepID=A0ABU0CUM9_9BACI|nr:hypothetical protein [Caldalkalibacillus uzonensis]